MSQVTEESDDKLASGTNEIIRPSSCEISQGQQSIRSRPRRIFPLPTISVEESPPLSETITSVIVEHHHQQKLESDEVDQEARDDDDVDGGETNVTSEKVIDSNNGSSSLSTNTPMQEQEGADAECEGAQEKVKTDSDEKLIDESEMTSGRNCIRFHSLRQENHGARRNEKSVRKALSEEGKLNEFQAEDLEKRLKALAAAFTARTTKVKEKIQQPPTPSSGESDTEDSQVGQPTLLDRLRQLAIPEASEFGDGDRRKSITDKVKGTCQKNLQHLITLFSCNYILDPQSSIFVGWLGIVSLTFLYNAWVIPLRVVFPYQTLHNVGVWFACDLIADFVYFVDIVAFKPHAKFLQSGFWVKEPKQTMITYLKSWQFKVDILALLPADIIVHFAYKNVPLLRLPRFLKVETFWELFRRLDTVLAHPHRARIFHTCLYMLYMIHMWACSYYGVSTWEGIGTTTWTFDGEGNAYVRCFYFATKTSTSIGKNPKPENELEYMFMTFAWLSGVFVFAILIGQIRDIIATATKSQTEYRILTSATVSYLHRLGVPGRLQDRVKRWLAYTWEQQKTLDETRILNIIPKNMKEEIALNIHVETLAKVQLFQNCETAFLRDLVVKLRSIIILPGDFVCRKGEIGREMFIVKSGKIQVVGGPSGTQVLATLAEGSVFGEIALLGIGGMNKRTADVRAAGFVNLFVLIKSDLNEAIRDYPEAQDSMQKKAKKLMKEKIKKERAVPSPALSSSLENISPVESEVIIKNKKEPVHLITTILKLFPPTTKIGRYLTQGSKVSSTSCSLSDMNDDDDDDTNGDKKLEEDFCGSFTSYPPSPFIPTDQISPDLDMSIMTGDSSDKRLSPPVESLIDDYSNKTSEDEYRSSELDLEEETPTPTPTSRENEWKKRGRRSRVRSYIQGLHPHNLNYHSCNEAEDEERIGMRGGDVARRGRNSCPHFESSSVIGITANREEIPVEMRPPLYIIEPGVEDLGNDEANVKAGMISALSSSSSRYTTTGSRVGNRMNSLESENSVVTASTSKPEASDNCEETPLKKGDSKSAAIIATRFISKLRQRSPLQRQTEVDVPDDAKVEPDPARPYSLDIESD